jgi:hypothetical protein
MNKTGALILITLVASVLVVSTFALQTIQRDLPASGTLNTPGLKVYRDSGCTIEASSIDFGSLDPGSNNDYTLWIKNDGNVDVTLNMVATNWNPGEAANYLSLTWNREGRLLNPDQVISCVITLTVSSNIQGINSFSLVITISGTG